MQRSLGFLLGVWVRGESGAGWGRLLCGHGGVFVSKMTDSSWKQGKGTFLNTTTCFLFTEQGLPI